MNKLMPVIVFFALLSFTFLLFRPKIKLSTAEPPENFTPVSIFETLLQEEGTKFDDLLK